MRSFQLIAALAAYRPGDEASSLAVLQAAEAVPAEDLPLAFQVTLRSGELAGGHSQALLAFLRTVGDEDGSLGSDEELGLLRHEAEEIESRLYEIRQSHRTVEPLRSRVWELTTQRDKLLQDLQTIQAEIEELKRQRERVAAIDREVRS